MDQEEVSNPEVLIRYYSRMHSWLLKYSIEFTDVKISFTNNPTHVVSVSDTIKKPGLPDCISQLPYQPIVGVCM
jgi:hypothetical protein